MTFKTIAGTAMLALALGQTAFVSATNAAPRGDSDNDLLTWCVAEGADIYNEKDDEGDRSGCCTGEACVKCEKNDWQKCHYEEIASGLPDGPITIPLTDLPLRYNR